MSPPRISVGIPTYNGASWLAQALRSVLDQDVDLEVVIRDDGSDDETVAIATAMSDPRVRVVSDRSHQGMAANWNRTIDLMTGNYVKLLMQDDALVSGSLSRQAALLDEYPSAGLAFGPRLLESDGSPTAARWVERYRAPHVFLTTTRGTVPGRHALRLLTRGRLRANGVGEPSVVMLRRSVLDRVGLFNPRIRQLTDFDLWLRVAGVADLAFDPQPVAIFRVHEASATNRNLATGAAWLDRIRIVESLDRSVSTHGVVGPGHYLAAIAAGTLELIRAVAYR